MVNDDSTGKTMVLCHIYNLQKEAKFHSRRDSDIFNLMGVLYSISKLIYKTFRVFMGKLTELLFVVSALKKFYLAKTEDTSVLKEKY